MNRHRVIALVALLLTALSLSANLNAADSDGVMMHDGKMMVMKEGKPTGPMENAMTMSNGTTVMSDGTVKMKDGSAMHMKDGQMMMMNGHMMKGGPSGAMSGGSTGGMDH